MLKWVLSLFPSPGTSLYTCESLASGSSVDKVPKNLTSLFFLINYIDWLSYWCGILNDVDIDAIKSIDLLKKKTS